MNRQNEPAPTPRTTPRSGNGGNGRNGGNGNGTTPLTLQEHLDACTRKQIEQFLRFWSPHDRSRTDRAKLAERLQRLMSDENVVYAKVDMLSERVRAVLLALLKKSAYTSDLQGLFRGVDGLDMEFYEGEAALNALAKRGFVGVSRSQEWLHYGRAAYAIPLEVALVMRGLAGTDSRPLEQIFVHARYRPTPAEEASDLRPGPLPDDVDAAIDALPAEHLRTIAREVIDDYGGIITRHEFLAAYEEREIQWESAPFLQHFGRVGLGTVGHVDMRARGLGVDDDVLVFFSEAVERRTTAGRAAGPAFDLVLAAHGDLMSDLRTALVMADQQPIRVSKEGSVYKAARSKLAERLQFPLQPLLTREEVADRVLALARDLGLVETNADGLLQRTPEGEQWADHPLVDKVQRSYALFLKDGIQTLRSHHLRQVHRHLVDLLREETDPDRWWPGLSLAMVARNRYLLELDTREQAPHHAPLSVRHQALTELGRAAQDLLWRDLFALGLVEVAVRGERPVGVRLSRLGRRVVLETREEAEESRPLVVNPDFELMVLPEGDVDDLLHALDRIATRVRTGEVVHYRLERERIESVTAAGGSPAEILTLLETHSRAPLPQNVVYSIRAWGDHVRSASMRRGILFEASDPSVVESILHHSVLKPFIEQVVDATTLLFKEDAPEREITRELRSLGVYVS